MRVSDYLQPVLDAALAHAETVQVFDDATINQTVRDRLAAERPHGPSPRAGPQALEPPCARCRGETVDADWTAWRPQGVRTSAYRAWRTGQTARTELSSAQTAVLYYDVQVTDTSAPRIVHPLQDQHRPQTRRHVAHNPDDAARQPGRDRLVRPQPARRRARCGPLRDRPVGAVAQGRGGPQARIPVVALPPPPRGIAARRCHHRCRRGPARSARPIQQCCAPRC